MGTAANVLVGATGKVYGAPTGTALPVGELAALNVAFGDLGYISDAGVLQTIGRTVTPIKAWGGDVIRNIRSAHDLKFKFTMLETKGDVLEAYYGDQTAPATVTQITSGALLRQEWVIDVVDGTNLIRIVVPDGEVTETGDITYATESAVGYEVTLSAYADTSGVKAYVYVHDTGAS